jgi:tRNA(Ile)-lysidine synthase
MSFSPERLREALERVLAEAGVVPTGHLVALSGGLDSTVLLAALAAVAVPESLPLRAIHVDHGLHPDAARWSGHSRALAGRFGVSCEIVRVDAWPAHGASPEAAARAARYAAFEARLRPGELLLAAHHGDDQLETVLLQWLRGGGMRAVAGMRPVIPFAAGWLVRPLLDFTREELRHWAEEQRLEWLEDPSNADPRFDRNYLRLEVLPAIRARWPAAARTVGRVAAQAADAIDVEADVAAVDLAAVAQGETLELARLELLPAARQRLVLRAWLRARALDPPSVATLEALRHDMLVAAARRLPESRWPGVVVRRYRGRLYASATEVDGPHWEPGSWPEGTAFDLGAWGSLEMREATGQGLSRERCGGPLEVVPRPEGAAFRPFGSAHHRELRKWLQERGVLPWRRAGLPCVRAGGEIVAIGDLACGGGLAAGPDEPSWRIVWHDRPTLTEAEAVAERAES